MSRNQDRSGPGFNTVERVFFDTGTQMETAVAEAVAAQMAAQQPLRPQAVRRPRRGLTWFVVLCTLALLAAGVWAWKDRQATAVAGSAPERAAENR